MIYLLPLLGRRRAFMKLYARKMVVRWLPRISGEYINAKWIELIRSVVLEWLRRKQAQGVERGWKDGGPGV